MTLKLRSVLPFLLAFIGWIQLMGPTAAQDTGGKTAFVRVQGSEIVAPDGTPLRLRGINIGNWIVHEGYMFGFKKANAAWQIRQIFAELVGTEAANRFVSEWLDRFIRPDDLRFIRQTGLNMIRVPIDYRILTPEAHPGLWDERGFALLDRLIGWAAEQDLYVLLDLHAAPCGQTGTGIDNSYGYPYLYLDRGCRDRTADIWARLAERYADNPTVIGYDLLNEPLPKEHVAMNPLLLEVYRELVAAVRRKDANHILFLGGAKFDTDFSIFDGQVLDENVVYTFHHYGAEPDDKLIAWFLELKTKHQKPVIIGESGENTDEWIEKLRVLLDRNGVGWAFWPYKNMDTTRSLRSYDSPRSWNEIVAY